MTLKKRLKPKKSVKRKKKSKSPSRASSKPRKKTSKKIKKPLPKPRKKSSKKDKPRQSASFPFGNNLPERDSKGRFKKKKRVVTGGWRAHPTEDAKGKAAKIIADAEREAARIRQEIAEELEAARRQAVKTLEKSAGQKLHELDDEDRQEVLREAISQIVDANDGKSDVVMFDKDRNRVHDRRQADLIVDTKTGEVYTVSEWLNLLAIRSQIADECNYKTMAEGYGMTESDLFTLFMSP